MTNDKRDNQEDVAANAAPEQGEFAGYEVYQGGSFLCDLPSFVSRLRREWNESVAAPLRAEIADLRETHTADSKFIRFYRSECARHGMTAKVDIDGWPIQLTNERALILEQENSTLRARIAELESQVVNMAEIANLKESEAMSYRAEAAEKRVATLSEMLWRCQIALTEIRKSGVYRDVLKPLLERVAASLRDQEGHNGANES